MTKDSRNDYLILITSIVLLGVGWGFNFIWAYAASALLGLGLSLALVVAAIRHREFGSDALALLAIVGSSAIGEWTAAAVITLMLATGRSLERWAQGRANNRLEALLSRAPKIAHVVDAQGRMQDVALASVTVGSRILVRSGEVVPLDATATTECTIDESALTGEPIPRLIQIDEPVASGTVNAGDSTELITTTSESDSTYSALVRLVAQSKADSAAGVRLANRWAIWFVPLALVIAGAAWLISGNVSNAVAVIVAATPCPLILAVPIAIIAGMSRSAASGSIVKGGQALESLAKTKAVMLDKTGTLTHGGPAVSGFAVKPERDELRILQLAASLEQHSPHVVAQAVVAAATARGLQLVNPTSSREVHGHGLTGIVDQVEVTVGQFQGGLPEWASAQGFNEDDLLVAVEVDRELVGLLALSDPIRTESKATISALHRLGVSRVIMATGDRERPAQVVAGLVGIDRVVAGCTPEGKLTLVRELQTQLATEKRDGTVLAVGDGINDAPALAAADVGVAMGARGATAASEAADVVIIEDSLEHLPVAIAIAQGAMARARQAAITGIALSVIAMGLGAFGILNPTTAALCQEGIDACAILWALVPPRNRLR
ncbi:MAG: cadmium-translocating P-type ATPase [Actinomycetales bacterium]|nr:cadmium-translocating P-type ATPase [Actinomycetales bacterium]